MTKAVNAVLDYYNLFVRDTNFDPRTLKFEKVISFDRENFEKPYERKIEARMEKILLELTKRSSDIERCALKIEESVKEIEQNSKQIQEALQNSNTLWQHYLLTQRAPPAPSPYPSSFENPSIGNDNAGLFVLQGPKGTLQTFTKMDN